MYYLFWMKQISAKMIWIGLDLAEERSYYEFLITDLGFLLPKLSLR